MNFFAVVFNVQLSELFPTCVRTLGFGITYCIAGFGYFLYLEIY